MPFAQREWQLLPHEWAFGGFLLLTAGWLAAHAGFADGLTVFFLVLTAIGPILARWCAQSPSALRWRVRLLWYPSAMGLSFYALPAAIAHLHRANADLPLDRWDMRLLGLHAADLFTALQSPVIADLMMAAYVFFFYYLIMGPAHYLIQDLRRAQACFAGLFTIYALGFTGYMLLPAAGPHVALSFAQPLAEGTVNQWLAPLINRGSNGIDAFPSIHVAVSAYLLAFDARHHRQRFNWLLVPCGILWVSTMYLRYHYFIDVVAGFGVTVLGLAVAFRYERSQSCSQSDEAGDCPKAVSARLNPREPASQATTDFAG